jgi:HSP20 family molecular chaperone IbpA
MATDWAVDLFEQDGELVVEVGLPGVRSEDISVMGHGSQLLISARRPHERGLRRYHLRGSRIPRQFSHEVTLPEQARMELAHASYVQGLLRVRIPLGPDDTKPSRAIPVSDAATLMGGSPGGAVEVEGGDSTVPAPGVPRASDAALPRRCAACGEWMDGAAASGPPPPATRFRYALCDSCK